jgi:uncharacterized protein (DUF2336 family)
LAHDSDIEVAGPVLTQSPLLSTEDLCEIAESKGNSHLLAISCRRDLTENITDVLVKRGDDEVARSVARNETARLSLSALERLIERAAADPTIDQRLRLRADFSPDVFKAALAKVSAHMRSKLEAATAAERVVDSLRQQGKLNEAQIIAFANAGSYDETVASLAALSILKFEEIENMMYPQRTGGLLLVGKSLGMTWPTINAALNLACNRNGVPITDLKSSQREFIGLSRATAERVMRFWHIRKTVA